MKAVEAFSRGGLWDKYDHYFEIYDRFLLRLQGRPVSMLEIGVDRGGSITAWQEYFGRNYLEYYGVDIDPACARFAGEGVSIFIGDQGDKAFVESIAEELPALDVIVDDGGHIASQQAASFEALFPRLANGGIYIVEDTHTSFWAAYQSALSIGNKTGQMGAIDYFSELAHLMMERWWNESSRGVFNLPRGARPSVHAGTYGKSIHSISFFDSVIVIEKRDVLEPQRIRRK